MTARLTVAQVVTDVKSGAEFTFDFLLSIIMAAWIAALGLMEGSLVNLVASMLVSPLMGPGLFALSLGNSICMLSLRLITHVTKLFCSNGHDVWNHGEEQRTS